MSKRTRTIIQPSIYSINTNNRSIKYQSVCHKLLLTSLLIFILTLIYLLGDTTSKDINV